jgi:hypothetical protein
MRRAARAVMFALVTAKHAPECALYAAGDELAGQGNR